MTTQYTSKELEKYGGIKVLMHSDTVVASGNIRTTLLNVMPFKEGTFFLRVSAHENDGATKNFIALVETKDPGGVSYNTLATFDTLAAIGNSFKQVAANLGENLTLSWTLGVNCTSVTFTVYAILKVR